MKRANIVFLLLAGMFLVSCGGGSSSSSSTKTSGIKTRALVLNSFNSFVQMVNYATDTEVQTVAIVSTDPEFMVVTPDKSLTLVFNFGDRTVSTIDNKAETKGTHSFQLPDWTESIVVSPDSKTAYAAVRNGMVTGATTSGAIVIMDLVNGGTPAPIVVPHVRWLTINKAGTKILAFSDDSNSVSIYDVASKTVTSTAAVFDRPIQGIFSSDDNRAFILSCGAECGGAQAKVSILDTTTKSEIAFLNVNGATTGLLDSNTLYVAGSTVGGSSQGFLNVLNVSSGLAFTKQNVPISDGTHRLMALGANNKLFIGANPCSNTASGCLSIYDTGAQTAVIGSPKGFVTGMQPIPNRSIVYVTEGGELRIYDTTTNQESTTKFIDIVGKAVDVKAID